MNYDIHDTTDYKRKLDDIRTPPYFHGSLPAPLCHGWRIGDLAAMAHVGAMDALILTRTVAREWFVPEADKECSDYKDALDCVLYTDDCDAANVEITVRMQDEDALLVALQLWKGKE